MTHALDRILLPLVVFAAFGAETLAGQSTRFRIAGRPGNCLQGRRSGRYQNVIIRVRYCGDLFHGLRAHPDIRPRGTLECRIYPSSARIGRLKCWQRSNR